MFLEFPTTFAYFSSVQDWLIVGVVALVLFGGSKIPELGRGLGEGIREFKKAMEGSDKGTPESPEKPS